MRFHYASSIQLAFPERMSGILYLENVRASADIHDLALPFLRRARERLGTSQEGTFPEIQAWRRAFSAMGLKPTQYRSASEALLRRYRKEGALPRIHPLVDLCNSVSLAYAIPIAVYDCDQVSGNLVVCHAQGTEAYTTFQGHEEAPDRGEVIFADDAGNAHARRWCNRQSLRSAMSGDTKRALIVAEALHETAEADVAALTADLQTALALAFECEVDASVLRHPDAIYDINSAEA